MAGGWITWKLSSVEPVAPVPTCTSSKQPELLTTWQLESERLNPERKYSTRVRMELQDFFWPSFRTTQRHFLYLGARRWGQPRFKEGKLGSTSVWEKSKVTPHVRKIVSQPLLETQLAQSHRDCYQSSRSWNIFSWKWLNWQLPVAYTLRRASGEVFSRSAMLIKDPSALSFHSATFSTSKVPQSFVVGWLQQFQASDGDNNVKQRKKKGISSHKAL